MSKIRKTYLLWVFLLPGFAACDKTDTLSDAGLALLSLPVSSGKAMDIAAFNEILAVADKAGEAWVKDPISIIRRLTGLGQDRQAVMSFKGQGEYPTYYQFVVINNGYLDDSIQGERYDIELAQDASQNWRIKTATKSWRCWPGRGHESFGTKPCA